MIPLENVSFLYAPGPLNAKITIVTSVDETGLWHARVISSTRQRRLEKLCASGRTDGEAMYALHLMASQSVHHHFKVHGASYPRAPVSDDESCADGLDGEDSDDELDDVSVWNDGGLDESDDETAMPAANISTAKLTGQANGGRSENVRPSVQLAFQGGCGNKTTGVAQNHASAVSCGPRIIASCADSQPRPASAAAGKGPAAPQLASGQQASSKEPAAQIAVKNTSTSTSPVSDATKTTPPRAPRVQHHVRLVISTKSSAGNPAANHPVHQLITTVARPDLHALLGAAVAHMRTVPMPGHAGVRGDSPTLRARVKRARLGGVMWDMGSYRADDMSTFFSPSHKTADGPDMPLFEIEVEDATELPGLKP